MTTEEAIQTLKILKIFDAPDLNKAVKMAIAALHAQQEPVKLDRSRWEGCTWCEDRESMDSCHWCIYDREPELGKCGGRHPPCTNFVMSAAQYCKYCGRPLTEGAWAELERRIGGNDEY